MLRRALLTGAVALVGATACGDYVGDDLRAGDYPRRDAIVFAEVSGEALADEESEVDPEPSDPYGLEAGTCFDDLGEVPLRAFASGAEVGVVPCGQPHRYELFARVAIEGAPGEAWPGSSVADERADLACIDAFEEFVGSEWEISGLDYLHLAPTEGRWNDGDRRASCALFDLGLVPLVGSMEGSGL